MYEYLRSTNNLIATVNQCLQAISKIYITTKGCKNDIFDAQSIEAIINVADGTPRLINKYCNNCFLIGNSLGKDIIDSEIAMKAINESELGKYKF